MHVAHAVGDTGGVHHLAGKGYVGPSDHFGHHALLRGSLKVELHKRVSLAAAAAGVLGTVALHNTQQLLYSSHQLVLLRQVTYGL